jgi:hypothetical protein
MFASIDRSLRQSEAPAASGWQCVTEIALISRNENKTLSHCDEWRVRYLTAVSLLRFLARVDGCILHAQFRWDTRGGSIPPFSVSH